MKDNLGIGVMLKMLAGNAESVATYKKAVNKRISSLELEEDSLDIEFDDGFKIRFLDDGQSCCEHRYMTSDAELPYFVDAVFTGAEIKEASSEEEEYGEHEIQFLEIKTDKGVFVITNHNEHNGYYGGFAVVIQEIESGE